jgi:hypothetical protein
VEGDRDGPGGGGESRLAGRPGAGGGVGDQAQDGGEADQLRVGNATRRPGFAELAGVAAAWFFGNNPAGVAMYDPATGRTFDGVNADRTVNRNSGAESTIHGLLSMLALDAHAGVAARARIAGRQAHLTWQLVEAEAGELAGAAEVVAPPEAWTGRPADGPPQRGSAWSSLTGSSRPVGVV